MAVCNLARLVRENMKVAIRGLEQGKWGEIFGYITSPKHGAGSYAEYMSQLCGVEPAHRYGLSTSFNDTSQSYRVEAVDSTNWTGSSFCFMFLNPSYPTTGTRCPS